MARITSPAEISEVLRCPDIAADLHNRDSFPLLGGTILTLTRTDHTARRRAEARLFARDALKFYEDVVLVPSIRRRIQRLAKERDNSAARDRLVHEDLLVFTRMVLVQLTATMMGLDGLDDDSEVEALYECAERFGEAASVEWSVGDRDAVLASGLEASDVFFARWMKGSLERRRELTRRHDAGEAGIELPTDLLTMLLVHAPDLDDDALRREAIFFLLASSSTTTHATPHVILELLRWLEVHPGDRELAQDIGFVKRSVNEALRLHPPVPALLRRALRDVTLSTGRQFLVGEHIALDVEAVNEDTSGFGPDPLDFDPTRDVAYSAQPYGYAFGGGPHMCLGRPLATSTLKVDRPDAPLGSIVRLVLELMRAGLELDPDAAAPRLRDDTVAHRFATFNVVLRNV